jgi:hypothetical protein
MLGKALRRHRMRTHAHRAKADRDDPRKPIRCHHKERISSRCLRGFWIVSNFDHALVSVLSGTILASSCSLEVDQPPLGDMSMKTFGFVLAAIVAIAFSVTAIPSAQAGMFHDHHHHHHHHHDMHR